MTRTGRSQWKYSVSIFRITLVLLSFWEVQPGQQQGLPQSPHPQDVPCPWRDRSSPHPGGEAAAPGGRKSSPVPGSRGSGEPLGTAGGCRGSSPEDVVVAGTGQVISGQHQSLPPLSAGPRPPPRTAAGSALTTFFFFLFLLNKESATPLCLQWRLISNNDEKNS